MNVFAGSAPERRIGDRIKARTGPFPSSGLLRSPRAELLPIDLYGSPVMPGQSQVRVFGHVEGLWLDDWIAALADAKQPIDRVALFVVGGASSTGDRARAFQIGEPIANDVESDVGPELFTIANDRATHDLGRIIVWLDDHPRVVLAALLRHELEHCCQFQTHGNGMGDRFDDALQSIAPAHVAPGSGVLYQRIPMERDANAAASRFVRTRFGRDVVEPLVEREYPLLVAAARPVLTTIPERMHEFVEGVGSALAESFIAHVDAGGDPLDFRIEPASDDPEFV